MEILAKLGIDWKLLIAQGVNFLLLLFLLTRFVYRPFIRHLDARSKRIEDGLLAAKEAKTRLDNALKEEEAILSRARHEAKVLMADHESKLKAKEAAALQVTSERITKMTEDAAKSMAEEKEKLLRSAQAEVQTLVVALSEKLLRTKLDDKADAELIERIVRER